MEAIHNADLIPIVAGLVALLVGGLWYGLRQSQNAGRDLKRELDEARRLELELRDALHAAEKQVQGLEHELTGERKLVKQQIEQFEKNRAQLKLEFENLANRILEDKTRSFDKTNKTALESLLKPFREQVEGFQKRINDVHSESLKGNALLESEIKKVLEVGLKIGSDAQNLTEALKGDSQRRGSWGETQLEKTLQMSGLVEHDHYQKQTAMKDAEGRRKQTDFLIKLPGDKHIIIDSKVSLAAYDRAVAAETDEQLERALAEHVRAVKRHIDDLQGKDYTSLAGIRSPGFVLMFMPIEPAYIEALKYEKDLFSYGYERGIVMVSHTTLIPILTTVANLWSMERSTREARELGDRAGDIYNQVRKVADNLNRMGASLSAVNSHFESTAKSLTGRQGLRGKVERFGKMSSKVKEKIPEIKPLANEIQPEKLELRLEPLKPEQLPEEVEDEAPVT
jgi:DNA recombination protein RmuC